ncbi:WRKY transcription factor SUSIBA2-like [Cicer arietinum]|uniref:WRKY transcription factor SUSIBA2-like n=1 Tax=Cicer arietinum TaxID=3827 RepID=UPI000640FB05
MEENNNINEKKNGVDGNNVSDTKGGDFFDFSPKRSIAERRGFNSNAARINTALFRVAMNPLTSPSARSPQLTIPSGISPTALLDSPIMLPNSQAMPSPTTGSFMMLPPLTNEGSMLTSVTLEQRNMDVPTASDIASSFKFNIQPNLDPNSLPPYSASLNQVSSNFHKVKGAHRDNQMLLQDQLRLDFSFPEDLSYDYFAKINGVHFYNDVKMVDDMIADTNNVEIPISRSEEASDESSLPENSIHSEDVGRQVVLEAEQKETSHATGVVRTSEDGYNWRKYGQKQVKGSEYPRSYYKCTQTNCQVKKKVERSLDGQITEIIYKGTHNHAKPTSSRRASVPSNDEMSEIAEANETCNRVDADSVWRNIQPQVKDTKHNYLDWKPDGQERTSSTSVVTEVSDPRSRKRARSRYMFETDDTLELSSTHGNHDGDKDGASQAVLALEEDAESESKRRKKESCPVETAVPSRAVREPRVVVQIESEVDILDDGYRWRKYGQKVVKGNPNPRSYYKCTSAGCSVRKHVERASHNLKYVITTYEGKHNHAVPTARNNNNNNNNSNSNNNDNNQINSSDGGLPPSGANAQMASFPKSEAHELLATNFDRKPPDFSNEFLRSSLIGSFSNDMKFGPSSISQMKYATLNNTIPYCNYGMNPDRGAARQAGPMMFPDFPVPLQLNLPSAGNYSLAGINFNQVKPMSSSVQSFLSGQQGKDIDPGFLRPKQELKDESLYNACAPSLDRASPTLTPPSSASASPSIYQSIMQNFPS